LRDFCTVRGLAISWLIVGMSAFTFLFERNRNRLRKFVRDYLPHRPQRAVQPTQSEIAPTAHC
jgi:hypothetical protein